MTNYNLSSEGVIQNLYMETVFMDTDSFVISTKTVNLFEDLKGLEDFFISVTKINAQIF